MSDKTPILNRKPRLDKDFALFAVMMREGGGGGGGPGFVSPDNVSKQTPCAASVQSRGRKKTVGLISDPGSMFPAGLVRIARPVSHRTGHALRLNRARHETNDNTRQCATQYSD